MQPFIIFSLARTGSTTLMHLLNCCPGVRCVFEPFNPTNQNPYLLNKCYRQRQTHGFDAAMQALWPVCNGFKHVWKWDGWPFPDNPFLNRQILVGIGAKVILLHRQNTLRRAISVQISEQMQLWTPSTAADFRRIRQHQFTPLDIPQLRAEIDGSRQAMAWARAELEKANAPWCEVMYEDLFEKTVPLDARFDRIQSLLEFIGMPRLADPDRLAMMRDAFDPAATGFQNDESYSRIPNIREVEQAFASEGSLFTS